MRTRPVRANEIDLFVDAAGQADHRKETERYLRSMFAAGSMRPEWCFVVQEGKASPLGRVAFWTLPGAEKNLSPFPAGSPSARWRRSAGTRSSTR